MSIRAGHRYERRLDANVRLRCPQWMASRPKPESNRRTPLCRRLPHHSGIRPCVPPEGLEPSTPGLGNRCSHPLSYEGVARGCYNSRARRAMNASMASRWFGCRPRRVAGLISRPRPLAVSASTPARTSESPHRRSRSTGGLRDRPPPTSWTERVRAGGLEPPQHKAPALQAGPTLQRRRARMGTRGGCRTPVFAV